MKRYRLKRDLPTFKAGETFALWDSVETQGLCRESDEIMAYHQKTLDKFPNILTDWFEEIGPPEPLIKDEKNRKVVRAWLEANDLDGATFHTYSNLFHYWNLRGVNDNGQGVDIDFFLTGEGMPNLIDGKYYTKFELCGEEG